MKEQLKQNYRHDSPNRNTLNFPPNSREYTFFSSMQGMFSKIGHMLDHETSINKFKKINISIIFSKCNGMELKINNNKEKGKFTTMWKLNNIILNNH